MDTRIHIKMGPIEVEYQGSDDFLKKDLLQLMTSVAHLFKEAHLPGGIPAAGGAHPKKGSKLK
jgi:hypothetical protein